MELNGAAFSFEVPETWEVVPAEGMVVASAPPGYLGFRPTIVLRESRIDAPALTTLAFVSQLANKKYLSFCKYRTKLFKIFCIKKLY